MIHFTKMHGIGNDFVMIDAIEQPFDGTDLAALARAMCDRRFGIGSDGIILVERGAEAPFRMRMLNPDGSEAEMCGNGIRCLANFLRVEGHCSGTHIAVETGAGVLHLELMANGLVRVDMGTARLKRIEIPVDGDPEADFISQPVDIDEVCLLGTAVSMGNPHVVFFVPDVHAVPLEKWGPAFERHTSFPNRINVHFVQVVDRGHLIQRTWERGAGATLACGTGACASCVAAYLNGLADRRVQVRLPGGPLDLEYAEDGVVWMTGPAKEVFRGEWQA